MKMTTHALVSGFAIGGASLALAFSSINRAQAATLLDDNFNADTQAFNVAGTLDSSFTVSTGNVDVIGTNSYDFYPGNGNYIDLNGNTLGGLTSSNSFTFNPGQSATLSFSYGTNGGSNSANVLLGGVVIDQLSSNNLVGSGLNNVTLDIANPQNGTLSFLSTTPGNMGIILDNVVLSSTAVPEPFTIIGTLFGGTAALRMRKKLKAISA